MKFKLAISFISILLLSCGFWGKPKTKKFQAFSDGFACSWSLRLYADGTFDHTLCADSRSGKYRYSNDSIYLTYPNVKKERIFLIEGGKVFEMDSLRKNLNWMFINQNDLN